MRVDVEPATGHGQGQQATPAVYEAPPLETRATGPVDSSMASPSTNGRADGVGLLTPGTWPDLFLQLDGIGRRADGSRTTTQQRPGQRLSESLADVAVASGQEQPRAGGLLAPQPAQTTVIYVRPRKDTHCTRI